MRLLVKMIFGVSFINMVLGVLNLLVIPTEYKLYTNSAICCVFVIQLIFTSILLHSPDKDSK